MIDRDGKQCESCGEGTYEIADLNDEIHGERHCNKCGHFVYRYERTLEELAHKNPHRTLQMPYNTLIDNQIK